MRRASGAQRLARLDQRALLRRLCARVGRAGFIRALTILALTAAAAFALGRYLRPAPPPLLIQRAANSPLSDLPVNLNASIQTSNRRNSKNPDTARSSADEPGYSCGARTRKGTPCHRRVHAAGERCFEHKGMPSLIPLSKLVVRP